MSIAEKLTTIAENELKVYEAGKQAGKQEEYDAFWDGLQNYGNRTNYSRAFFTCGKLDDWFYPKHDMNTSSAQEMFRGATCSTTFDLAQRLEDCGVVMDTSQCTTAQMMFAYCNIKRLPTLDFSSISNTSGTYLTFAGCYYLEDVRFSGTTYYALDFSGSSNLSTESVQSIIDHLADLTGQTAQTLTFHADVGAALTDEQKAAITEKNWTLVY